MRSEGLFPVPLDERENAEAAEEQLDDSPSFAEEPPHRGTFSRRLAIAFAAVAALTAVLAGILISSVWNYQFDEYLRGNLQRVAEGVAQITAQSYVQHGGWTSTTLNAVASVGSIRNVTIQIIDSTGSVIYDDSLRGDRVPQEGNVPRDFVLDPQGPVATSPVVVSDSRVGTVRVWVFGEEALLNDRDVQFRRGSFIGLTTAALVAIGFASLAGVWYAKRLVRPIETITEVAQSLRSGDRKARTHMEGNDEISVLGKTFDEMADAIEADRQLERRLTADVAHELRTPLQAIQATVEAMQDGVLPADEERLGVVRDETVRLARLADGILELTRLERGSLPFSMKRLDVAAPVRAAVDAIQALLESRELTISIDIAEGVFVRGDADRLQQAVANLLSNAARYTPPGGRVDVRVAIERDQAVIEVADNGVGIAEEDLQRVFGRFWRADSARAAASGGLGIGLSVTKEIVERHRGSIGVESAWGSGARFTIRLPRLA